MLSCTGSLLISYGSLANQKHEKMKHEMIMVADWGQFMHQWSD